MKCRFSILSRLISCATNFGRQKRNWFYFFCSLSCFSITTDLSANAIPQGFGIKRYEALWKRSPFTLESVVPELQKGFAADLMLVGTFSIGPRNYVTVVNSKTAQRFLVSETLNSNGILLVSIEKNEDPTKVTATLKKGEETSIVKFDPAALKNLPSTKSLSGSPRNPTPMKNPSNMMNSLNTQTLNPASFLDRPDPKKFIRKRLPIPNENPEETKRSKAENPTE